MDYVRPPVTTHRVVFGGRQVFSIELNQVCSKTGGEKFLCHFPQRIKLILQHAKLVAAVQMIKD